MNVKMTALKWFIPALVIGFVLGAAMRGGYPLHSTVVADLVMETQSGGASSPDSGGQASAPPRRVTLPDAVQAPVLGFDEENVRSAPVSEGLAPDTLPITGKLAFNAERVRQVSSRTGGRLERVLVFEGTRVTTGQILAELYSPDYMSAQNEYLLARNTARMLEGMKSQTLLEDAKATMQSASNRLRVLGTSDDDIEQLDQRGTPSSHLFIRSPVDGVIIKRTVDQGAYLNVGDPFVSIADPGALWFYGNVYEQDYAHVAIGQEFALRSPALPGQEFRGRLTHIAPSIDPVTHTLAIRCEVPNPSGDLRPELFVSAQLLVGKRSAVIAPKSALVRIKDASYVIVDRGAGLYQRMPVQVAPLPNNRIAILSGINSADRVLVEGAVLVNELIAQAKRAA